MIVRSLVDGKERTIAAALPDELAFSPAGDRLAITWSEPGIAARVEVFVVADGKRIARAFPFGTRRLDYDSGTRVAVAFVGGGERLALQLASDTPAYATLAVGAVPAKRWTLRSLRSTEEDEFGGMAASLGQALAVSPDGSWLAVGNFEKRALLLAPTLQGERVALPGTAIATALAFVPDGTLVAAAGEDGPLRLYAVPAGTLRAQAEAPRQCQSLAVSPDGRRIAGGCDGTLRIWDVPAMLAAR